MDWTKFKSKILWHVFAWLLLIFGVINVVTCSVISSLMIADTITYCLLYTLRGIAFILLAIFLTINFSLWDAFIK